MSLNVDELFVRLQARKKNYDECYTKYKWQRQMPLFFGAIFLSFAALVLIGFPFAQAAAYTLYLFFITFFALDWTLNAIQKKIPNNSLFLGWAFRNYQLTIFERRFVRVMEIYTLLKEHDVPQFRIKLMEMVKILESDMKFYRGSYSSDIYGCLEETKKDIMQLVKLQDATIAKDREPLLSYFLKLATSLASGKKPNEWNLPKLPIAANSEPELEMHEKLFKSKHFGPVLFLLVSLPLIFYLPGPIHTAMPQYTQDTILLVLGAIVAAIFGVYFYKK